MELEKVLTNVRFAHARLMLWRCSIWHGHSMTANYDIPIRQ